MLIVFIILNLFLIIFNGFLVLDKLEIKNLPKKEKKEVKKEEISEETKEFRRMANLNTMLENIDCYDGSTNGQKDLPYVEEDEEGWI